METKERLRAEIIKIENEKKEQKKAPVLVLSIELFQRMPGIAPDEFRQAINELVKENKIEFGHTINNIYFKSK